MFMFQKSVPESSRRAHSQPASTAEYNPIPSFPEKNFNHKWGRGGLGWGHVSRENGLAPREWRRTPGLAPGSTGVGGAAGFGGFC